jgi:hypothetical protein
MNPFDKVKEHWTNQEELKPTETDFKEVLHQIKTVKKKQQITNAILAITIGILVYFFFYVAAYNSNRAILGLSLMIGTLLIRVILELWSIKSLDKMNTLLQMRSFQEAMIGYYKKRIRTHYVYTPLLILGYIMGFISLLPLFEANLSSGFYTYIKYSGIVVLLALSGLIIKQVALELATLRQLQDKGV